MLIDAFDVMLKKRNGLLQAATKLIKKYRSIEMTSRRSVYDAMDGIEQYPIYSINCRDFLVSQKQKRKKKKNEKEKKKVSKNLYTKSLYVSCLLSVYCLLSRCFYCLSNIKMYSTTNSFLFYNLFSSLFII